MSPWILASGALVPALAIAAAIGWRGRIGQRLAAYQLAGSITVILLTLLTFATDQPSLTDLALTLVLLTLPGTLLLAVFVERWL
ncbi:MULTISPECIES: monovalent cation/H+ antiporter complex subunit F [Methylobacterium]|uniref:Multicomponent Na+:H+ antiporter subunit F n=1 Tax=Methylobacterium pseudosasicola TaxID=582667 RepID=A0A1I4V2Y4_9HYPH|nr:MULTISPECIES: monovalent cation/H+ antiporter complex subunit F [Methylobacterium]MCJ2126910.1 monovalent cation/H+ antiporter complex subunit F [Methylobacterium sp. J-077]SFM95548.1 multicomponent Na+:H+ antiporter subunit F [Methylobacterium pseudosasicola]